MKNRIKQLRLQAKLTTRELAARTGCCSNATITRIENEQRKVSTPQAKALASYFGVSMEYLLGEDPKTILSSFVNSHEGYYVCGYCSPEGNYSETERVKDDPTIIKFQILRLLNSVDNVEKLNNARQTVYEAISTASDYDEDDEPKEE